MGVTGLPERLKGVGNLAVYLGNHPDNEKVAVIIDGGFLLHKMATRGEAAYQLVLKRCFCNRSSMRSRGQAI